MMTRETIEYLITVLRKESGLVLDESKVYLIEVRLDPIAKEEGFASIDDLAKAMRNGGGSRFLHKIVEAMATYETTFFRDITPFEILKNVVLPGLVKSNEKRRRLRIWSAACSSGQEPYSLAMVLCDLSIPFQGWDTQILATDISESILERARSGAYTQYEVQRGLPIALLARYFQKTSRDWEVRSEIKKLVQFRRLNFLSDFSGLGPFDVIFCRNVLIYFDGPAKRNILERMARELSHEGVLFLGGAETTLGITDAFVRVDTGKGSYYKKAANPATAGRPVAAANLKTGFPHG